ncbi:MAG: lipoyl synthase [Armatimonadetes bacterium]|nr:lipoyl synthase [Armatimonadota bacterium]
MCAAIVLRILYYGGGCQDATGRPEEVTGWYRLSRLDRPNRVVYNGPIVLPSPPSQGASSRLPAWLRVKTGKARLCAGTKQLVAEHGLQTVCENARCPNIGECYSSHTATFLIMGRTCTRNCRFCAVQHGTPSPLDPGEPERLAAAARELGLDYAVVTSVTRDDLPDGGAAHFAATIRALHRLGDMEVEVLVPDFGGLTPALHEVLDAGPAVINHNLETVRRLSPMIRPQADYERSLQVLREAAAHAPQVIRKSGLMAGLGESDEEIYEAMVDLQQAGCQILTIGQYLQPSRNHWPVDRYVTPERFTEYARWGESLGIAAVVAGPFVRSSYRAAETARSLRSRPR